VSGIGTLNERSLHAALKRWYARPGDEFEATVEGYVVDIVRDDLLVEIQTRGFSAMKRKLRDLTDRHRVRLVYPIPRERWVVRLAPGGNGVHSRRKSPLHGDVELLFNELVSVPDLLAHPSFAVHVLLIQEERVRRFDPTRRGCRRWVPCERRLLEVCDERLFRSPADLADLLPDGLPDPFTTGDLSTALRRPRRLAQRMAYCLRALELIEPVGRSAGGVAYARCAAGPRRGVTILGTEPFRSIGT